jgi:TRAP-type mannitol/chloroaromatic compound transport system permease small subunit
MERWLKFARGIDRFSQRTGHIVYWLTLAMVVLGSFNAIVRYLDKYTGLGLSSNTYIELQWYLFGIVFLLGAAYTLRDNAHVRVDVLYGRLSRRGRAWINIAGTLAFLLPFCIVMIVVSWPAVRNAFALLALQGVSMLVKAISVVRGSPEAGADEDSSAIGGHV